MFSFYPRQSATMRMRHEPSCGAVVCHYVVPAYRVSGGSNVSARRISVYSNVAIDIVASKLDIVHRIVFHSDAATDNVSVSSTGPYEDGIGNGIGVCFDVPTDRVSYDREVAGAGVDGVVVQFEIPEYLRTNDKEKGSRRILDVNITLYPYS